MTVPTWGGDRVRRLRRDFAATFPQPCAQCGKPVDASMKWVLGHRISRGERPDLTWNLDNLQIEHDTCSRRTATAGIIAKAKAEARAETHHPPTHTPPPPNSSPPPPPRNRPTVACVMPGLAGGSDGLPVFAPLSAVEVPWLADIAVIPADGAWPLLQSPPHPAAVGSYGHMAREWIERELSVRLRWWQVWALTWQLAHDAEGRLVYRTVVESTPRRSGKSVRLRTLALFRTAHPDLFGEQQLVLLAGKDTAIVLEHHRKSWQWAREHDWTLRRRTGAEEIEAPDGSRFIIRGRDSVYGYDTGYGIVDEAWGVPASAVDDGLEPSLLERTNPQLHLTSTSHRRATSLMRRRITAAISGGYDDTSTLTMVWAAHPDADHRDPAVWRSASPHWTPEREAFITTKFEQALSGQADPEIDDPDPLASFKSQYLNTAWFTESIASVGDPVIALDEWAKLVTNTPVPGPPVAQAVEGWFNDGCSVASAWPLADEQVMVRVIPYPSLSEAVKTGISPAVPLLVGKSLAADPILRNLTVEPVGSTTRQVAEQLRRLLDDDSLRHDQSDALTDQVLGLRVTPGPDGPKLRSNGRADAVKAAIWAAMKALDNSEAPAIF